MKERRKERRMKENMYCYTSYGGFNSKRIVCHTFELAVYYVANRVIENMFYFFAIIIELNSWYKHNFENSFSLLTETFIESTIYYGC